MANKHDLGNMIFNLENRKDLKSITFTRKAVVEVLGYLKELQCLELKLDKAKEEISSLRKELADSEVKYDYDEDEDGETVEQVIVDNTKYIDIEYFARVKADLEAKLAEKNKIIETQHNGIGYWKSVAEKRPDFDYVVKIKDLEQQLAEKEKEYKRLSDTCVDAINQIKIQDQDKISFCIEKLEKVLNFVDGRTYLAQYIKEQIEELKKEQANV